MGRADGQRSREMLYVRARAGVYILGKIFEGAIVSCVECFTLLFSYPHE